jgi:hydroxymethylpyrimidine pyrophosphatase-like HAD family hydrolase
MKKRAQTLNVRLVAEGTRVVVLTGGAPPYASGVISQVRPQTNLKAYVVTCDDGAVIYASAHSLAREDDATVQPLGVRHEY